MILTEKEKILSLWRELYESWEITKQQLEDTYYHLFMKDSLIKRLNNWVVAKNAHTQEW